MKALDSSRLWWLRGGRAAAVMEALRCEPVPDTEDGIVAALAERLPDIDARTAEMIAESLLEIRD